MIKKMNGRWLAKRILRMVFCGHHEAETDWAWCPVEMRWRPVGTRCVRCGRRHEHRERRHLKQVGWGIGYGKTRWHRPRN